MFNISFRKLRDNEEDYLKLYNWCSQEYIYEWFEQRKLSYYEIVNKYQSKINKNEQELYIIKCDNQDIGLVQVYKYKNDLDLDKLKEYKNVYEYDVFIGEKNYLNNGIGKQIIKLINSIIYTKYNAECIILRPFKRNIRAIRCYEKCGFRNIYEYVGSDTLGNKEKIIVLINKLEN